MEQIKKIKKVLLEHKTVLLIISLFLAIKLLFLFRFHNLIWDEAVYVSMGKYIFTLGSNGIWEIIRPLGLPFIFGLSWKLFPSFYLIVDEIIELLFAAGSIFLVYAIANKVFSKKAAIIAAFLYAFTPLFFLYSGYLLSEIPSTFFILLSIYFFVSTKYYWSAAFASLALYFRFPQGLFLVIIAIALFIELIKTRQYLKHIKLGIFYLLIFFLVLAPFMAINYSLYKDETCCLDHALFRPFILASYHQNNPADALPQNTFAEKAYNAFYYVIILAKYNFLLLLAFVTLIFFLIKKMYKDKNKTLLFIFILISMLYYSIIDNKQERFALVFLPIVVIFAAYTIALIYEKLNQNLSKIAFITIICIFMITLLITDLNFFFWRSSEPSPMVSEFYQYYANQQITNQQIDGIILTTDPVPAAYTNAKFHPFYESVDEGIAIINKSFNTSSIPVTFTPDSATLFADNATSPQNIH